MATPITQLSPSEIFSAVADQMDQVRKTLNTLREKQRIRASDALLHLEYHLEMARGAAADAAVGAAEQTMTQGGGNAG